MPMICNAEFRDPTQPAYPLPPTAATGADNVAAIELVLSAIWITPNSRRATINGVVVKQGQTIDIKPVTPKNTAPTNRPKPENQELSVLADAIGNPDIARPQQQNIMSPPRQDRAVAATHAKTYPSAAQASTIKIIDIDKNSVTIDQNGKLKTLQLVQRPYQKSINTLRTLK